ncbi:MAG TPA: L-aspartate oxidase [Gammaproteobacteria bacterium]|nr:L-aspartate oxidase [Gammaproteobacteria bacterium]
MSQQQQDYDILVIGSGAAGLSLALHLAGHAPKGARVAVLSKSRLTESNTLYAQGGVSAVVDAKDSIASHVADTMEAGAGLCRREVVEYVVERGHECIRWLKELGVPFTTVTDASGRTELHLTREGGHTHRRIVHAADATGKAVEETLEARVRGHPQIAIFENHLAIDLIYGAKLALTENRCLGAYVYDRKHQHVVTFRARFVVMATGGAGKVYLYTSNPDVATGDGIAMAWRAGCRVANMEFIQFHPTCLYHPRAKSFLITEAIRGEGGRLLLPDGAPFMHKFDPRAELAPRDIVARAIDHEMKRLGADCVYLDIHHRPAEFIREHFPTIQAHCLEFGIDMTHEPIPVVPAAHYICGGVVTDLKGRTDLPGLYVIGEAACTGLHGANRMASNSLLECCVFARAAAADILSHLDAVPAPPALPFWDESQVTDSDEEVVVSHNWEEVRRFMWDYVGIVRTTKRLQRALHRVQLLHSEIADYYGNFRVTNDLIELRNLAQVAELIIHSALLRKESRGLHYTLDYPNRDDRVWQRDTVLSADTLAAIRRQ